MLKIFNQNIFPFQWSGNGWHTFHDFLLVVAFQLKYEEKSPSKIVEVFYSVEAEVAPLLSTWSGDWQKYMNFAYAIAAA